jgi:flagellar basal-body rod modification protein FlgD
MAINNVSGTGNSAATEAPIEVKTGDKALGREDFMKLLIAQLKNQDPNDPVDTKEMVTQLSQLTSVEQLVQMGTKLDTLTAATNSSAANSSAALIGKSVTGVADTIHLGATGGAETAVKLSQDAAKAKVSVVNEAGRVVRTFDLDKMNAGNQPIKWDGKTDGGERAASGKYTFQVDAKDKNNVPIETDMSVQGIVGGVFYENGYPELDIGGSRIPLTNVTSISQ